MDFSAFDTAKMDKYAAEAKARWGKSDAYKEFEQKTAGQTAAQMRSTGERLLDNFAEFGAIRHTSPASAQSTRICPSARVPEIR